MNNLFNTFVSVVENGMYTGFFVYFMQCSRKKKIMFGLICFIALMSANFLLSKYNVMIGFASFITAVIGGLLVYFCSSQSFMSSAVIGLTPDLLTALINSLLTIVFSFFFYGTIDFAQLMTSNGTWLTILSKALQAILFWVSAKYLSKVTRKCTNKELSLIAMMVFMTIISIDAIEGLLYTHVFNEMNLSIIVVTNAIAAILLIATTNMIVKRNEEERKNELEKQLIASQLKYTHDSIAAADELHRLRHDVQHLLASLPESVVLTSAAKDLQERLSTIVLPVKTISPVIDTVINIKRDQAASKGIRFDCILNIIESPQLSEDDLYVLLVNLLDNAIEHIGVEKTIKIDMKITKNYFLLTIANSVNNRTVDENGNLMQTEEVKHGYGLKTIQAIVDTNAGNIRYEEKNHIFMVTLLFS
jgi:signal transduction histidine kinase